MSTYAIGDTQGCYQALLSLLQKIHYRPDADFLWFSGDLVNRGPESLKTLLFIKNLVETGAALTVLGNHDLHLLALAENAAPLRTEDTIQDILAAPQRDSLAHWLRQQPLCHYDSTLNFFMVHAGLIPEWSIADALRLTAEVSQVLQDDQQYLEFLQQMYGNEPLQWSESLRGQARLRFITNVCTRLRFCSENGVLDLKNKGVVESKTADMLPWFAVPDRKTQKDKIIFGHWAALYPAWHSIKSPYVFPVDSGCVWGNGLTALCLETEEYFWVSG